MSNPCQCPGQFAEEPSGPTLVEACSSSQLLIFLRILQLFLQSQCDISDPCRQPKSIRRVRYEYDFIVVGAGAAGCAIAARLAENHRQHQVLLIEAGGSEPLGLQLLTFTLVYKSSAIDWGFTNEPTGYSYLGYPGQKTPWPRGKMVGGSSSLNGMVYMRGNRHDYDNWERLGNPGWSYNDVLSYFIKSEDHQNPDDVDEQFHGIGGPMAVSKPRRLSKNLLDILRAAGELGHAETDLNGANATGIMVCHTGSMNGVRVSSAKGYLRPNLWRPNLHILLHTQVTRVLLRGRSNRAFAVEAVRDGTTVPIVIRARKEVILSAGTEQSPKILMHSGIGPSAELRRWKIRQRVNLPGVGRNLQNHVALSIMLESTQFPSIQLYGHVLGEYFRDRSGPLELQLLSLKFASVFSINPDAPDVQIMMSDNFLVPPVVCSDRPQPQRIWAVPIVLRPKSRGRISLRSADPLAKPIIYSNELEDDRDIDVLIAGLRKTLELFGTSVFKGLNLTIAEESAARKWCGHLEWMSDEYWRCVARYNTISFAHPVGTCRMGRRTDPLTVVDHQLRVHGVRGLRVADGSIMPRITSGNTCTPIIMIGEKAADMICRDFE